MKKSDIDKELKDVMGDFLPNDYDVPMGEGNYMRLEEGENKFRVLQKPILGWELWIGKKPKRYEMGKSIPVEDADSADLDERTGEPRMAKHFWAMVVYNYDLDKVQVLELTQKTILRTIRGLAKSKDWGSPLNYDLSVVKSGKGFETSYDTIPSPPKPLSEEVSKAWKEAEDKIDIEVLFEAEDPFAKV